MDASASALTTATAALQRLNLPRQLHPMIANHIFLYLLLQQ